MRKILGIETSCDETGISIIQDNQDGTYLLLSHALASQTEIHKEYGGVYPMMAKRAHIENLPLMLKRALEKAGNPKIDAIAVTYGPGLSPCLWTGINFATELSKECDANLIPIDHIEAHILMGLIEHSENTFSLPKEDPFPALAVIVSGGHTQIILMKAIGSYQVIGETVDDAAGEALDKTARILGLEYPGGPAIYREAQLYEGPVYDIELPRPMLHSDNYDLSFSGLKTAVLYDHKKRGEERDSKEYIREMAHEIQSSMFETLTKKTVRASKEHNPKTIILGGGVSANQTLRETLEDGLNELSDPPQLLVTDPEMATDNGIMAAIAGALKKESLPPGSAIEADPNLRLQ